MIKLVSLFSGSSGNCIFLSDGETRMLIDAGLSGKRIEAALSSLGERPKDLKAILVTHEHSDHTMGIGVLARRHKLPIYASNGTWNSMGTFPGKLAPGQQCRFMPGERFLIGGIDIEPFPIPHDAAEPVGYSFRLQGRKITVATDIGHMNRTLLRNLEGSDVLLLESNHDIGMLKMGRYPWPLKQRILGDLGHLCNEMAGKVAAHLVANGARCILLGHLSQENNFPELAWQTAANALAEKNLTPGDGFHLEVARRDRTSSIVWIDGERIWCEPVPFAGLMPEQIALPGMDPGLEWVGIPGAPELGLTGLDAADDWLTIRVAEKD
jgi:phosphoribosyl 1,2-cyclic phosphodiesterase